MWKWPSITARGHVCKNEMKMRSLLLLDVEAPNKTTFITFQTSSVGCRCQPSIGAKMPAWTCVKLFCGVLSQQWYVVFCVKLLSTVSHELLFPSRGAPLSRMLRMISFRLARSEKRTSSDPALGVFALIPPTVSLWCEVSGWHRCLLAEKCVRAIRWSDDGVNSLGNFRNERYRLALSARGSAELPHARPCP